MESKKLVYVAGALNAPTCIGYIHNLHRMLVWAKDVRDAGFAVFTPGNDFLEGLVDGHYEYEDFFDNSQVILARCDAVFVVPRSDNSKGTQREIIYAKMLCIPVFDSLSDLKYYFDNQ